MKRLILLSAISITILSAKAQDRPKEAPKKPKTYTIGLEVDSAAYESIQAALYKTQVDLNQSKASHTEVNESISFIEALKKLFADQKKQQDQIKKEDKPKKP